MRVFSSLAILIASLVGSQCVHASNLDACLKEKLDPLELVAIDDGNHRVFAVWEGITAISPEELTPVILGIEACMPEDSAWKTSYSLSVFSNSEMAGYKTDPKVRLAIKSGQWRQSYLAEYDRAENELILSPAVSSRRHSIPRQ